MNLSLGQALKSKTIWAAIGVVALNGLNAAAANPSSVVAALHLDPQWQAIANGILAAVAIYGRSRPVQGVPGK